MGFLDNIFGGNGDNNKKKDDGKKQQNPLDQFKNQISKLGAGQRKFQGEGQSLGGSKPGTVIPVSLDEEGPLGMQIEKRPNSEGTAIVARVVEGSQAERAGLQRGDIICFAGSNGQEEIMYTMVLELASSNQRPLQFDIRRIKRVGGAASAGSAGGDVAAAAAAANKDGKLGAKTKGGMSAEDHHRKQAMIAAAEAREKAHKAKQKPVSRGGLGVGVKYKSEEQKRIEAERLELMKAQPESAEAQKAKAAVKAEEARLAAELGYNPYETAKSTAGQARNATTTTQHGSIQANNAGMQNSGMAAIPQVTSPVDPVSAGAASSSSSAAMAELPMEFQDAFTTLVTTNEATAVTSSLDIMQKLTNNATTKGQDETDPEKAAKFRRVRLSNAKINAAVVQLEGAIDVMMSVGFQLHHEDGEDYLVYPSHVETPGWIREAISQMKNYGGANN
eukprot:CAMPEP_0119560702 /NCGR_PEP_ID=MMETSP1352-20130426/15674_1 /TAXON_ID=265584 /ORGANISM="Stauroneis constricta, Strain CCMP1120" /LENGTH=446 /DNA_ID=CAMNT_0007608751 /DNA_START=70 /DNA_END=1410 /DNA_ORIENTATION=-